jgi:hypothetical protein
MVDVQLAIFASVCSVCTGCCTAPSTHTICISLFWKNSNSLHYTPEYLFVPTKAYIYIYKYNKIILQMLLHVSVPLCHLQGAYILILLEL